MSKYWNTRTQKLSPYTPGEQPQERKFIKINTNENPYPPSPKVIEAVKNAACDRLRLYPDPLCTEFREAASACYGVKPSQVFAGNGSDEVLAFAFGAFFQSAETDAVNSQKLLFPDITYSFYPVYANLWNIPYRTIPLRDDFFINIDDYKIFSGGVIFPNPNAPTGIPVPLTEILSLAGFLETQGKVLIVDEAYIAFGAESAVPYINKHPNLLTIHTFSKSASLAGLRAGFAIGSEEIIEGLCRIRDSFNSYPVDTLAITGAAAAVKDAGYYNEINAKVTATRERTARALREIGFHVLPSAANFLFVKAPGISGEIFFNKLRERGILVRHFNKPRISDYLRVSMGTDPQMDEVLQVCCDIIGKC
ncbi:MAG: histidinol-phosphate transaminase [Treponema sp.]|jgi:histidinol-phosphate aminotransferase|nr:histidinol-phosphate transaminase [Treponema sp.]